MSYRVVDETEFERDFQRKIEGTLVQSEKNHAEKRLKTLRQNIVQERQELHVLFSRLNSAADQANRNTGENQTRVVADSDTPQVEAREIRRQHIAKVTAVSGQFPCPQCCWF